MNEDEKEAIECLELVLDNETDIETEDLTNKCINNILNLIDKQQKEIEELKKTKYILNAKTGEIKAIRNNFISKDKIKEKIEEYKKKCDECNFQKSEICKELKVHYNCSIQSVLELLNELLGE